MTAIAYDVLVDWDHNDKLDEPYADEVRQDSPVGWWRLEETSGTTADDEIGTQDGTYIDTPSLGVAGALLRPTGTGNLATQFDGGSDLVSIAANAQFNTSIFSAECWINPDTIRIQGILGKAATGSPHWRLHMDGTGKLEFDAMPGDIGNAQSTTLLAAGTWYHVAVTFDLVTMRLYVNGVEEGSAAHALDINTDSEAVIIAPLYGPIVRFDGSIDEVAYYQSALSAARIKAHFDAGRTSTSTSPREAVTSRVLSRTPVTCSRGRDQVRELTPPEAGTFSAELNNVSKDYSAEYASSPLAGKLLPGRKVRLKGDGVSLWTGYTEDVLQAADRLRRSVEIPAIGPFSFLRGKKVSTALWANIRTDEALGFLLDEVGWPTADRVFDPGKTTMLYWWLKDEDAFDAAVALWATEGPGANLYEDGQGRIVFESRHYRLLTSRALNSQATLRDTGADPTFTEFAYESPAKDVVNEATVTVVTRSSKATAVVWTLGGSYSLGPNEVRRFKATAGDPFTDAIVPVAGTDYVLGSGTVTPTLDRTSGQVVTITFTAGSSGATIDTLQLRANPVTEDDDVQIDATLDVTTSQDRYGKRSYSLNIRQDIDPNVAQDFANAVVRSYSEPRPIVEVGLLNASATNVTHQINREISDRVTVVEPQTGLDTGDHYYIESIAHETDGHFHRTTLGLEKVVETSSFWLLGVAGRSELGSTTLLGY